MSTRGKMSSIITFPDLKHPFVNITSKNNESYFFLLPLEVRLMIYEYVVAAPKAIRPKQVSEGSNKFVWGLYEWKSDYDIYPSAVFLKSVEPAPLDVISLARVSRRVYHELEAYPVFYRVNIFDFDYVEDLHVFLSAITPKRREMIRYLDVYIPRTDTHNNPWSCYHRIWSLNRFYQEPYYHPKPFVLSLLSQCKNIRELRVHLDSSTTPACLKALSTMSLDAPSPWNLPFVRVKTTLRFGCHYVFGLTSNVPNSALKIMWTNHLSNAQLNSPDFAEQIHWTKQFNSAMLTRSRRAREEGGKFPQWFIDLGAQALLERAVGAAGLDFPGEIRVNQDRLENTAGPVSSRTRRKNCTLHSPTGVLSYQLPKYSADGMLVIWNYRVIDVRWNDSLEIECALLYINPSRVPSTSWEKVESVIFSPNGESCLCMLYDNYLWEGVNKRWQSPHLFLEHLMSVPSPQDVFKLVGDIDKVLSEAYDEHQGPFDRERRLREWGRVSGRWASLVSELEVKVAAQAEQGAGVHEKE